MTKEPQPDLFTWSAAAVDERLYDGRPPHEAGSETSRQAAERLSGARRDNLRQQVLWFLVGVAENGATDDEMQVALGLRSQTQSPRRRELQLLGLIVDSGTRRATRAGRPAVVWQVTSDHAKLREFIAEDYHEQLGKSTLPKPSGKHRHKFRGVGDMVLTKPGVGESRYASYEPLECPVCHWAWLARAIVNSRAA